jgi:hypothetical protein
MNAPPEANSEYSRGSGASGRLLLPRWQASSPSAATDPEAAGRVSAGLAIVALLGALLVILAQFTALYHLHSASTSAVVRTVGTGSNHAWAPIPLALLAAALAYAIFRQPSRAALAGLVALGIATLLIALIGDLPDAHSSGLIGSSGVGYVQATSSPSAGLYIETLGAVLLLLAGGVGLLMLTPRPQQLAPNARTGTTAGS